MELIKAVESLFKNKTTKIKIEEKLTPGFNSTVGDRVVDWFALRGGVRRSLLD